MPLLEIIGQFIVEVIFESFLGGIIIRINNVILKLRGIETMSAEEIKFHRIKERYQNKVVQLIRKDQMLKRGMKGVVLEVINSKFCMVDFGKDEMGAMKVRIKDLLIIK